MKFSIAVLGMLAVGILSAGPQAKKQTDSPDAKEIRDYRLNMDKIQKFAAAFDKMSKDQAVEKCSQDNPAPNSATLDASQKALEACPAAVAILNGQGLKPREFLILTGAMIGDMTAVKMKKAGQIKEYPSIVSPENAAFLEQNFDKINAMMAAMSGGK